MLQFDIRAVLKQKAPNAHVPGFLIRYLERIAHIKQMNAFLRKYPDVKNYDFIRLVLDEELGCSASIDGIENIPTDGKPLIFASNHPLGGLDGMIIAQMIHESRSSRGDSRPLKVIVNDLLMFMEPLAGLWAPVNKVGRLTKEQAQQQHALWESETDVLTFPAGICSRLQRIDGKWQIQDKTLNGRRILFNVRGSTNAILCRSISKAGTVSSSIPWPISANCCISNSISKCSTSWMRCTEHTESTSKYMCYRLFPTRVWILPRAPKNGQHTSNKSYITKKKTHK